MFILFFKKSEYASENRQILLEEKYLTKAANDFLILIGKNKDQKEFELEVSILNILLKWIYENVKKLLNELLFHFLLIRLRPRKLLRIS